MASSTAIRGVGKSFLPESILVKSDPIARPKTFVSIPNSGMRKPNPIAASIAAVPRHTVPCREQVGVFSDNLDGWMKESVTEIVKSLKKAPLMVHVYCNESTEVKTEKGSSENWDDLKKEWREGERSRPDGIILVQELEDEGVEEETKAWGVLIQGKCMERECRTACYLLKTCSVNSGLGLSGTHFSLVKVKNFRESALSQIKNSWLL